MTAAGSYELPAKLDLSTAHDLARDLLARRGAPLTLDASGVTHIGTPGLQILLSARKTWEADNLPLSLVNFGAALAEQLSPMGLSPADLAPAPPGGGRGDGDRAGAPAEQTETLDEE